MDVILNVLFQQKNFQGHFFELHYQPSDHIRALYLTKNHANHIIALYNLSQNIVHLRPTSLIFTRWSLIHIILPLFIASYILVFILFILFFYVVSINWFQAISDAFIFSTFSFLAIFIVLELPYLLLKLLKSAETVQNLRLLGLDHQTILMMEKVNSKNHIYFMDQFITKNQ